MSRSFPAGRWFSLVCLVFVGVAGGCQNIRGTAESSPIAMQLPPTDGPLILHVRSDAFDQGEEIPLKHSAYDANLSPSLSWSGLPTAAKSIVILVEDPDAQKSDPAVHWVVYNLPATIMRIPMGIPTGGSPAELSGASQGGNSAGSTGYSGPMPPKGEPAHHYHFQVFALDIPKISGGGRNRVVSAMTGHVVAKGEVVGTYRE